MQLTNPECSLFRKISHTPGNKCTYLYSERYAFILSTDEGQGVMRILVVEDDMALRYGLHRQFSEEGFCVDLAADGVQGLLAGMNLPVDVAIVDIGLPKISGLDVIRRWRESERSFPVVILTARDGWHDRVEGLLAGADDYVGKPFRFEEVNARVCAVTRRAKGWASAELVCGPFVLDTARHTASVSGTQLNLTTYEQRLLELLMLNAGKALSAIELSEHMYQDDVEPECNIVAQLICRLRRKLDPQNVLQPIETVHGFGYRFAIPRGKGGASGGQ
jgi:two-component system, OmpR family, response regulator PhoP